MYSGVKIMFALETNNRKNALYEYMDEITVQLKNKATISVF